MTKQEFHERIMIIVHAFERRQPAPETLAIWFAEIGSMPPDELARVAQRIIREEDQYPRNMVKCVMGHHRPPTKHLNYDDPRPSSVEERKHAAKHLDKILGELGYGDLNKALRVPPQEGS
jgi:hypothetical protein